MNEYNARIRSEVGEEIKRRNSDMKIFHWMMKKTGYVGDGCPPYVPPSVEAAIIATADASSGVPEVSEPATCLILLLYIITSRLAR